MEHFSAFCLLFLLCFGLDYNSAVASGDVALCRDIAAIYERLERQIMEDINQQQQSRVSVICPKIAEYISHAIYTENTCPDLPLVEQHRFQRSMQVMNNAFNAQCADSGYTIKQTGCSVAMVNHLVQNCTNLVNLVQFHLPRLQVCQISRDFIDCHERAQGIICSEDEQLFNDRRVPQTVSRTRQSLYFLCDASLADEPWASGPRHRRSARSLDSDSVPGLLSMMLTRPKTMVRKNVQTSEAGETSRVKEDTPARDTTADPDCPPEIQNGQSASDFCHEEKEKNFPGVTLASSFQQICQVFEFVYGCNTELHLQCGGFVSDEEQRYFHDQFERVYGAYGCDFKV